MPTHHGMKAQLGVSPFCSMSTDQQVRSDRFGRMFHQLPPLYTDPQILQHLGSPGGPMDGGDTRDSTSTVDVGQVFFGQFIDHDITLDVTSGLSSVNSAEDIDNIRTPTLDLDCIYGPGPEDAPFMYVQDGSFAGVKLLTGEDVPGASVCVKNDLVRSVSERAIIGDHRNDENRIISQIQLGMIRFHNHVVDSLAGDYSGHELFVEARSRVLHHYHWAILYDFLPMMCGEAVVWDILKNGRQFYCIADGPYIPVEFSVAAYRFGHSMAPHTIQVQKGEGAHALFGSILGGGFTPLSDERAIVDFHELFTTSEQRQVQKAEKLDTKLAKILLKLPFIHNDEASLATRNLLRGQSFLLPAGEVVAAHMGRSESEIAQVSQTADNASGGQLGGKTPLWFYLLAEAEEIGRETTPGSFDRGEGLGPVGARMVAEVIIGLMEADKNSFMSTDRSWSPEKGVGSTVKTVGDMLTYGS